VIIINKGRIVANDTTEHLQHKLNNEVTVIAEFKQKVERSLLGNIKGVKAYEQMKDGKWSFVSNGQSDLREEIFYFAKNKDLTLVGLQKEEFSLEDIFKQVTA
jgi:ABC-2 type transport system ATP-binding protein